MSATGDGLPEAEYYDVMAEQARSHWWYVGRRALVAQVLAGRLAAGARILDVGCGTGDNLGTLDASASSTALGLELVPYAIRHAPLSPGGAVRVGVALAEHLPVASASVDLVTSLDVVEHLDDDVLALREYRRALRADGLLLLTVPAYPGLWSEHDEWAAHRRRYRARTLERAVREAGFEVIRTTHFNSFLVPPAVLMRRTPLRHLISSHQDEVGDQSPVVGRVMEGLASLERRWTRRRNVGAGLSILCLARRVG